MSGLAKYNSLEDFLITNYLSVDSPVNHESLVFPVKGREIEATILFADISSFSQRTLSMSSTETLIFVNYFFAVVTNVALRGRGAIIDKYIGDEIMVVFSKEFGASDPFREAVEVARWMSEDDVLNFAPHIGIASGRVTAGFVGTPAKYNCSAFGSPVALAARCAGVKPETSLAPVGHGLITFPALEWAGRDFDEMFPPTVYQNPDGSEFKAMCPTWKLLPSRKVALKNLPDVELRQIVTTGMYFSGSSPEERAKSILKMIESAGRYWPR